MMKYVCLVNCLAFAIGAVCQVLMMLGVISNQPWPPLLVLWMFAGMALNSFSDAGYFYLKELEAERDKLVKELRR